jgi:hypothetical protein
MDVRSQKHAVRAGMPTSIRILKRRVLLSRAVAAKSALLFRGAMTISRDDIRIAAIRRR